MFNIKIIRIYVSFNVALLEDCRKFVLQRRQGNDLSIHWKQAYRCGDQFTLALIRTHSHICIGIQDPFGGNEINNQNGTRASVRKKAQCICRKKAQYLLHDPFLLFSIKKCNNENYKPIHNIYVTDVAWRVLKMKRAHLSDSTVTSANDPQQRVYSSANLPLTFQIFRILRMLYIFRPCKFRNNGVAKKSFCHFSRRIILLGCTPIQKPVLHFPNFSSSF